MTSPENRNGVHHRCWWWWLAVLCLATDALAGVVQPMVQTYYVPQPAQHLATLFNSINSGVNSNAVHQLVSIVIHQPGTIIVFDHWEDGYEADPNNPVQSTTQIWGDGNPAHGMPPGYTTNILNVGDVITLESDIYLPRAVPPATNGTPVLGDGGDRISSTRLIGIYTAGWPIPDPVNFSGGPDPGYQIADMMAMYPTKMWGTNFVLPLGTNIVYPTVNNPIFNYAGVMIQAMQNNTTVTVTNSVIGAVFRTLSQGETWFINGGVPSGTTVKSTAPIQVDMVTGRINATWECRAFPIVPLAQWGTSYWNPISTVSIHPATVFLYNANNYSIVVSITTTSGAKTPVTVPANSWGSYTMVDGEAAHFYSANTFWAASAQDTVDGGNWSFESGVPLVNEAWLNTDFRAAWANGTVGGSISQVPNGNPVWVTPLSNTTMYVDYDGNAATGAFTDPAGNKCDLITNVTALTQYKLFNNTVYDQSAMHVYTLDGTKLSVAYAEDADVAQAQQNVDVGCTVVTFNDAALGDTVWLDLNGNGVQDAGEPGLANVKLTLTSSQGTVVTYTDNYGKYLFPDLLPGVAYTVTVDTSTLPPGLVPSYTPTMPHTVGSYQTDLTANFGFKGLGTIGSTVWNDFLPNGIQQLSEPGMTNVGVIIQYAGLDGVFGTADDMTFTRYTATLGGYQVTNLPMGNYRVQLDPTTFSPAYDYTTTNFFAPTLTTNAPSYLTANFGLYHPSVKALYLSNTGTNSPQCMNRIDPVFANSNLTSVSTEIGRSSAGQYVFADDRFLIQDYNNNDGSIVWDGGWSEVDVNQGANPNPALAGDIMILSTNVLQIITGSVGEEIRRGVDLSLNATNATLSFKIVNSTLNANNTIAVEASYNNGATWAQLGTLLNSTANGTQTRTLTTGSATTLIRFRVAARNANQVLRLYDVRVDINRGAYTGPTTTSFYQCQSFAANFTPQLNGTVTASAFIAAPQGNIPTNTANITATIKTQGGAIIATLNPAKVTPLSKPFEHSVADDFETGGYSGSTGSDPWANVPGVTPATNSWQEVGDDGASITGDIRVIYDSGSSVLRVQNTGKGAYRVANLSFATYAKWNFAYRIGSMMTNAADGVLVQISTNGTTWATLDVLKGPITTTYSNVTYDITGYISTNTYIRYYQTNGYNTLYVNNVMLYWGQKLAFYELDWTGTVTNAPTMPLGQGLQLDVTTGLSGNYPFSIQYGSASAPSVVNLSAATIINVDSVAVYDAAYPAGSVVTNGDFTQTPRYLRATVSDPFGSNDVTGVSLLVQDPTGATTNIPAPNLVASTVSSRTFELSWGPFNAGGVYAIAAAAAEGSEGIRVGSTTVNYRVKMNASGRVVNDTAGTGVYTNSGSMAGITNVPVALYTDPNGDGNPADGVLLTNSITGSSGSYNFFDLTNGYYVIVETNLNGWTSTADVAPPNNDQIPIHVLYTNLTGLNFLDSSNALLANVTGRVINDTNGFGDLATRGGMAGITNVTVCLYSDPNGDGDPSDGVLFDTVLSGTNGTYTFTNVPPGNYVVVETNLPGWTSVNDTTPPNDDRISVVRTGSTASTGNDFLDSQTPHFGSIGNNIYWDVNNNGTPDPGEGLAGVRVFVDSNGNGVADPTEYQAVTDANGHYTITNVPAGTYHVKVDTNTLAVGFVNTVDPDGTLDNQTTVMLTPSQLNNTTTDFGYRGAGSIGTTIFLDVNTNNVANPGEGLSNVVVYIDLNHDGNRDPGEPFAVTSGTNGTYLITNLPSGSFDVKVDVRTLPVNVINTVDPDGVNNNQATITLAVAQHATNANWGYQSAGTISGTIYNDGNTNYVQEVTERGIPGVTVGLYYTNGNPVLDTSNNPVQVSTDNTGFYQFSSVMGGNYLVEVDPLGNTLPAQSSNTQDPDGPVSPSWGNSQAKTNLAVGGAVVHMDFGYVVPKFLRKTVNPANAVNPGDTLTYTLKPYYAAGDLLVNVTVSDPIPDGASYAGNASPTPAIQPTNGGAGTVTWNLGSCVLGTNGTQAAASGTTGTFGTAVPIDNSTPSVSNFNARVFAAGDGSVHVVYINTNAYKLYYTKSIDGGATWWNPVDISTTNSNFGNTNAAIAVDSAGNVHVVADYRGQRIYYRKFTVTGTPTSPILNTNIAPKLIDTGSAGSVNQLPDMEIGSDGTLNVVFNYNNQRTYYTKSTDGGTTWFNAVDITSSAVPNDRSATVGMDTGGYVHVVIGNGNTNIYYFKFTVAGTPASPTLTTNIAPKVIDAGTPASRNWLPKIAVDPTAAMPQPLHVVFLYTNGNTRQSFYTTSGNGGTNWASALNVTSTGANNDRGQAIAVDNCGNIHLAINQNNQSIWYSVSTNGGASFTTDVEVDTAAGNSADRNPSLAVSGTSVHVVFDHSSSGRIYYNTANLIPCEVQTTNVLAANHTLVTTGDTIAITMTVTATQAVNNIQPVGLPIPTNILGGVSVSNITAVDVTPKNISAGGSASFSWNATAVGGTVLPGSLVFVNSATGQSVPRSNTVHFSSATANSVLISPPLTFQVTVNNPPTVTDVINIGTLLDQSILTNGIPSTPVVDTVVNVSLDFGDLPDYGTNGPGSYQTLLARNGPRHIINAGDVYIGTTPTDAETNAWQSPNADGDNTHGTNDENGVVFGQLVQGLMTTLTITNVSGVNGVLNAWADWNHNGVFDANERIFSNLVLVAGITATNVTVNVPPGAVLGATGFRFRVTNKTGQGGDSPTGLALSGEVEDYYPTVTAQIANLSGRVINDTNGYGDLTSRGSMPGITNVPVALYTDPNGDGNPADGVWYASTLTGTNGTYTFTNVLAGNYVVVETNLPGWTSVNDVTPPNNDRVSVVRTGITPSAGNDFLDSQAPHLGSIGDTIFWDKNLNGVPDAGEGISGVTVFVDLNGNGIPDTGEYQATTDASGHYLITNVPLGTYTVMVATNTVPAGYANSVDPDGVLDNQTVVTLTTNQMTNTTTDFGYQGTGSIGTTIFNDLNTNNLPNAGEGLSNVVVYIDANHNGVRDPGEIQATTGTNGTYQIGNLPAGTYDVKVDASTLPANLVNTVDPDGTEDNATSITLTAGQANTNANWGYQAVGSISGTIYNDANTNQVQDTGELGLSGITVGLYYTNGNPVLDVSSNMVRVTTDGNGFYQFTGLVGGSYQVRVDPLGTTLPAQSTNTQDPDGPPSNGQANTNLTVGGSVVHMDFGYVYPSPFIKTVSPSTNANPGAILTYTLRPSYGNQRLTNVTVSDVIPTGATYNGNATPTPFSQPAVSTNGTVTWNLGSNTNGLSGIQFGTNGGTGIFGTVSQSDSNTPASGNALAKVVTGSDGTIHVVYNNNLQNTYYTKSTNAGSSWWAPVKISSTAGNTDRNADLAVDSSNYVHVVYDNNSTRIYYFKFIVTGNPAVPTLTTNIAPKLIDTNSTGNSNRLPQTVIGPDGVIHVVYNYNNQRTFYTKCTDGGTTWYYGQNVSSSGGNVDQNAALAVDYNGGVHVVIDNNSSQIYYRQFTVTGTPTAPTLNPVIASKTIDSGTGNRRPKIAVDATSPMPQPVHVVYNLATIRDTYYTSSTDDGTNWTTPLYITSANGANGDTFADLVVDACGKVHVAMDNNSNGVWYAYSSNNVAANLVTGSVRVDPGLADGNPAIALGSNAVYLVFDRGGHIYFNKAATTPCEIQTTNTMVITPTLVTSNDTITISMTLTTTQAVNSVQPVGLPVVTNANGGASVSGLTAVFVGPTNLNAGGSVTFTWTATALSGTALPCNLAAYGSATGLSAGRSNLVHFAQAVANSVIISPPLVFQVKVNTPATVTDVINSGELKDGSILSNGIPSTVVDTPLNVGLDYGDLPDYGTNGPGSYATLLARNGPRHIVNAGDAYIGTIPTDTETNAWQSVNADGDNTHGTNDENGVVFGPLVQGQTATLTITNISGRAAVINAWADWNSNGVFEAGERILTDFVANGTTNLTLNIPPGATPGATAFRFRVTNLTGQGGDSPTGLASSGEVEDYRPVVTAAGWVTGRVYLDNNADGLYVSTNGDSGLNAVTVKLTNSAGAVYQVTTDTNGWFQQAVPPGVWSIVVPTNNASLSNLYLTTDVFGQGHTPAVVTVPSGGSTNQNFGYVIPSATAAFLTYFKVYGSGGGAVVRWGTATEMGTVSYALQRLGGNGEWVGVTVGPVLAAGELLGSEYEVLDAGPVGARPTYQLVEWDSRGTAHTLGVFREPLLSGAPPALKVAKAPAMAVRKAPSQALRKAPRAKDTPTVALADLGGVKRVKLTTQSAGLCGVSAAALGALLGQSEAAVREWIGQGNWGLLNQGRRVGGVVSADGGTIYFYAQAHRDNYSWENVYWLGNWTNPPVVSADGQGPKPDMTGNYQATVRQEREAASVPWSLQTAVLDLTPEEEAWMWKKFYGILGTWYEFPVVLEQVVTSGMPAGRLTLRVHGGTPGPHVTGVTLNDQAVGQVEWAGATGQVLTVDVPAGLLVEGTNWLKLAAGRLPGVTSQWYLNNFELNYQRQYQTRSGALEFGADNNEVVSVSGFTQPGVTVLDVTVPTQPGVVTNVTVSWTNNGYVASLAPPNSAGRYVAFQAGAVSGPAAMAVVSWANLAAATNQGNYVLIAPAVLADAAGELAAYRQTQGLVSKVVTLEQIYDEMNAGIVSPWAIQDFLALAFRQWAVKPGYAVLVGNGTYDYRNLLGYGDNLIPPLMMPTPFGLTGTDSLYGDVNGDGVMEVAVGRLPVLDTNGLARLIGKIKQYEGQPTPGVPSALLVADVGSDFANGLAQADGLLAGKFTRQMLVGTTASDPVVRAGVLAGLNQGVDLLSYIGHGATEFMGGLGGGYLTVGDVATNLSGGGRLPVVVAATCSVGQYMVAGVDCLAEALVLSDRGAIGVMAPSGMAWDSDVNQLNTRLVRAVGANGRARLGDLLREGLAQYGRVDQRLTPAWLYNLMGDPGLLYNVPKDAVPGNQPPGVGLTGPTNRVWSAPAELTLTADAYDLDGTVVKVEYYEAGGKVGEATEYPYAAVVSGVGVGLHDYVAVATDDGGATSTSGVWQVVVVAGNQPPVVSVDNPVNGQQFDAPASLVLQVSASDADGTVAKVEFFAGDTSLGVVTAVPYELTLTNVAEGEYWFRAVATDNQGSQTVSAPVGVKVAPFRITTAVGKDGRLTVKWAGGKPPYQLETKGTLAPSAPWQTGSAVRTTNATLTVPSAGFLRIRSAK